MKHHQKDILRPKKQSPLCSISSTTLVIKESDDPSIVFAMAMEAGGLMLCLKGLAKECLDVVEEE